jgi:two-component system phosphate regulon sensor histidine kinase PhoR
MKYFLLGFLAAALLTAGVGALLWRRALRQINALPLEHIPPSRAMNRVAPLLQAVRRMREGYERELRRLRRRREELLAITERMNEGFLLLDAKGHVLLHNQSACQLLGSPQPGGEERPHVFALCRARPFCQAVLQGLQGKAGKAELPLHGRHLHVLTSPVMEAQRPRGAAVILFDVTEAAARNKLRREFSANAAHELRTPLTVVLGYAELLQRGAVPPAQQQKCLEELHGQSLKMQEIIQGLLLLSKLDEGAPLPRQPVELLALCQAAQERLQGRGIPITVAGEALQLAGVPAVLEEMIFNLIENAVKYNRPGGSVTVALRREGDEAVLTVADTGIGIAPQEQERVFERFYRVDKSHHRGVPGSGLGLAIVKHGAQLHGAAVSLQSSPAGSVFTLRFPLSPAPPAEG